MWGKRKSPVPFEGDLMNTASEHARVLLIKALGDHQLRIIELETANHMLEQQCAQLTSMVAVSGVVTPVEKPTVY
mgnify:FL=1